MNCPEKVKTYSVDFSMALGIQHLGYIALKYMLGKFDSI
jgi:hypothetical protein